MCVCVCMYLASLIGPLRWFIGPLRSINCPYPDKCCGVALNVIKNNEKL